ncbi:MAG: hypothetical protein KDA68_20310, partial [Planctomycetaceae bacterium]|nr:hypothetical protein [Planctomycetaceae bacterium]
MGHLFSKVLNSGRSRDWQRLLIRGVVIATILVVIFCTYFGWRSRSRLSEIVARKGSLHLANMEISTDQGSRILTDPQGLKYLEERISQGKIIDPEIH